MKRSSRADRLPLFIVGCGRSGTTLVYEAVARHPEAAWFSTWTDRTLRPELAAFNTAFKRDMHSRRVGPRPSEGYRIWDTAVGLPASASSGVLGREHASARAAQRVGAMIAAHRRFGRGSQFVNKNTRNTRRVQLIDALVEARFVHVVRSPLDTVASLLEVKWWDDLPLWWLDGATPPQLSAEPVGSARLAAELWSREVAAALDAMGTLPAERHREIRYEDFVRDPAAQLRMLFRWLGLSVDERVLGRSRASSVPIGSHTARLSPAQIEEAWSVAEPTAVRAGYSRRDA
jgi:hypothetical protein